MDVVLTIDGLKAIPVRALPFVAGRRRDGKSRLSADEVAGIAAHQDTFHGSVPFATYHIVNGMPQPVASSQWGRFVVALKGLSARLKDEHRNHDVGYARWSDESIPLLPAAVFVWLDEFQAWFSRTRPLVVEGIPSPDDDGEVEYYQDSDDLCFSPLVPEQLCQSIREGFEAQFNAPVPFESLAKALEGWFDKPKAALPAWQRHRVNTDFSPMPWDELSKEQRPRRAAEWDAQNDPATAQERSRAWDLVCRRDDVRREIQEWALLKPNSITEKAEQANRLRDLHEKALQLDAELVGSVPQQDGCAQALLPADTPVLSTSHRTQMSCSRGDFLGLLQWHNKDVWQEWIEVREDGVYANEKGVIEALAVLFGEERKATVELFPIGTPLLKFPFSLNDLMRFDEEYSVIGCINGDALEELERRCPPPASVVELVATAPMQSSESSPKSETPAAPPASVAVRGNGPNQGGRNALAHAMEVGFVAYRKIHGTLPTARALFVWLGEHDQTGTIVGVDETTDKITWKRVDGGMKDTAFKSFQNRFTGLIRK